MKYINDPNMKFVTYKDLVALVIKNGIEPQKAYIYLAGRGVRGYPTRVMGEEGRYSEAIKVAYEDGRLVEEARVCGDCGQVALT